MKIGNVEILELSGGMLYRQGDAAVRTIDNGPERLGMAFECLRRLIDEKVDDYTFYKHNEEKSFTMIAWRNEPKGKEA